MTGYKKSRIREAILETLKGTRTHPPADKVWEEVKKIYPSATLATVYRNLHILESQGKILALDVGQGEKRYDGFVHHHAHFVCRKCGEVYDCEIKEGSFAKGMNIPGEVEAFQLTLYGVCERCMTKVMFPAGQSGKKNQDKRGR
ncbi:Transcriptional regulator, FUR family [Brevinematales bacterium NS]|nr:Transcriptional regulator, FUR family [Brevinematales bacterium NS]